MISARTWILACWLQTLCLNAVLEVSKIPLGEGAYGKVYSGRDETGKIVAIKAIKLKSTDERRRQYIQSEIDTLASLPKHPALVSYLGCESRIEEDLIMIIMEKITMDYSQMISEASKYKKKVPMVENGAKDVSFRPITPMDPVDASNLAQCESPFRATQEVIPTLFSINCENQKVSSFINKPLEAKNRLPPPCAQPRQDPDDSRTHGAPGFANIQVDSTNNETDIIFAPRTSNSTMIHRQKDHRLQISNSLRKSHDPELEASFNGFEYEHRNFENLKGANGDKLDRVPATFNKRRRFFSRALNCLTRVCSNLIGQQEAAVPLKVTRNHRDRSSLASPATRSSSSSPPTLKEKPLRREHSSNSGRVSPVDAGLGDGSSAEVPSLGKVNDLDGIDHQIQDLSTQPKTSEVHLLEPPPMLSECGEIQPVPRIVPAKGLSDCVGDSGESRVGEIAPSEKLTHSGCVHDVNLSKPSDLFELQGRGFFGAPLIDESRVADFCRQILAGLQILHEQVGIVHRDLKPENILVSNTRVELDSQTPFGISYIICDFGMASPIWSRRGYAGSPGFVAPEIAYLQGKSLQNRVAPAADIWAFGRIVLSLFADGFIDGESPWRTLRKRLKHKMTRNLYEMINACLDPEPANRPTASELLSRHPFLQM